VPSLEIRTFPIKAGYRRDFNRLNPGMADVRQLYDEMLEIYPDRVSGGAAKNAKNQA
jgi:hypothetical protein